MVCIVSLSSHTGKSNHTHSNTEDAASGAILGDTILLKDTQYTAGPGHQTNEPHTTGAGAEIPPELQPQWGELTLNYNANLNVDLA